MVLSASIMGIDIYARWNGQTEADESTQFESALSSDGSIGYLREAYHGEPYATTFLFREAFESKTASAPIRASVLRERLPEALRLAETRERKIYGAKKPAHIEPVLQCFRDFVSLCERKEKQTGSPVTIVASY